jgi:hypothetical protein
VTHRQQIDPRYSERPDKGRRIADGVYRTQVRYSEEVDPAKARAIEAIVERLKESHGEVEA